jgi:hypothetical protein
VPYEHGSSILSVENALRFARVSAAAVPAATVDVNVRRFIICFS